MSALYYSILITKDNDSEGSLNIIIKILTQCF